MSSLEEGLDNAFPDPVFSTVLPKGNEYLTIFERIFFLKTNSSQHALVDTDVLQKGV